MSDAVKSLTFLGQATYPTKSVTVDGTTVGGLSGITYDPASNRFYVISDDRGTPPNEPGQPPRFYTLNIDLSSQALDNSKVTFAGVTRLQRQDGTTYAPLSTDTESIRLTNNGTVFIVSEGQVDGTGQIRTNPTVAEYNLATGQLIRTFTTPSKFLPNANTAANLTSGTRDNLAFESVALTPDNRIVTSATENALFQDGPSATAGNGSRSRIFSFDARTGQPIGEFLYNTDPVALAPVPATGFATAGLVDLTALDNSGTRFLGLERSFSSGVPGTGNSVKIYEIDLAGATNISNIASLNALSASDLAGIRPAQKRLVLNIDDLNLATGLDNIEGITFGPTLPNGQPSLVLTSDDNFSPGTVAFTQILAFSVDLSGNSRALAQPVTTFLPNGGVQIVGTDDGETIVGAGTSDRLIGLGGDDVLSDDVGNNLLNGNGGNDLVTGGGGDDSLFGGQGDDALVGNDGNDQLSGDRGNDSLDGGAGNDTLTGVSPNFAGNPGLNEVDVLTGGPGADVFALGDRNRIYYDDRTGGLGTTDYALITDFNPAEDSLRLIRNPNNTGATYAIGDAPASLPAGAGLYIDNDGVAGLSPNDELVAVLQGLGAADASAITARFSFA